MVGHSADQTILCSLHSPYGHTHIQNHIYLHNSYHTYYTIPLPHLSSADFIQAHRASKRELPSSSSSDEYCIHLVWLSVVVYVRDSVYGAWWAS